jgi:hypothetical protein
LTIDRNCKYIMIEETRIETKNCNLISIYVAIRIDRDLYEFI